MRHVSVAPPPDELEHKLKDAYVRFADIDSRAAEAKKTCTAYINRVQPVIDCVKGHDVRWNVKVAQTLKSLGERRADDLQKCKVSPEIYLNVCFYSKFACLYLG